LEYKLSQKDNATRENEAEQEVLQARWQLEEQREALNCKLAHVGDA